MKPCQCENKTYMLDYNIASNRKQTGWSVIICTANSRYRRACSSLCYRAIEMLQVIDSLAFQAPSSNKNRPFVILPFCFCGGLCFFDPFESNLLRQLLPRFHRTACTFPISLLYSVYVDYVRFYVFSRSQTWTAGMSRVAFEVAAHSWMFSDTLVLPFGPWIGTVWWLTCEKCRPTDVRN